MRLHMTRQETPIPEPPSGARTFSSSSRLLLRGQTRPVHQGARTSSKPSSLPTARWKRGGRMEAAETWPSTSVETEPR